MHTSVDLAQLVVDLRLNACKYLVSWIYVHMSCQACIACIVYFQCNYYIEGIQYCALYVLEDSACHLGDTIDASRLTITIFCRNRLSKLTNQFNFQDSGQLQQ